MIYLNDADKTVTVSLEIKGRKKLPYLLQDALTRFIGMLPIMAKDETADTGMLMLVLSAIIDGINKAARRSMKGNEDIILIELTGIDIENIPFLSKSILYFLADIYNMPNTNPLEDEFSLLIELAMALNLDSNAIYKMWGAVKDCNREADFIQPTLKAKAA